MYTVYKSCKDAFIQSGCILAAAAFTSYWIKSKKKIDLSCDDYNNVHSVYNTISIEFGYTKWFSANIQYNLVPLNRNNPGYPLVNVIDK